MARQLRGGGGNGRTIFRWKKSFAWNFFFMLLSKFVFGYRKTKKPSVGRSARGGGGLMAWPLVDAFFLGFPY